MAKMKPQQLGRCIEICNSLPVKYAAIVAIGVSTGCRISEILALRRSDLIKNGELRHEIQFVKLKARKPSKRKMIIPATYRPYLVRHLDAEAERGYSAPDDFVFRGHGNGPIKRTTRNTSSLKRP